MLRQADDPLEPGLRVRGVKPHDHVGVALSNPAARAASQPGSRVQPKSVTAMTSPVARPMATFRPAEMLAPGRLSIRIAGRPAAHLRRISREPSVEPPSTMTTSSGVRVCLSSESSEACRSAGLVQQGRDQGDLHDTAAS